MNTYIDTNIFIYAALDKSNTGHTARKILTEIKAGKRQAHTSIITISETLHVVKKTTTVQDAQTVVKSIIHLPNMRIHPLTTTIMNRAIDYAMQYSLDTHDAIHLATMIENSITTILSQDKDFDKVSLIKRKKL